MHAIRLLWLDLCTRPSEGQLFARIPAGHEKAWSNRAETAARHIREFHPQLACIEFDYPDARRLLTIPALARKFPALPLLMFTEYHSEALAVWAFRSGVSDYRVKPIPTRTFARIINIVACAQQSANARTAKRLPADFVEPPRQLPTAPSTARRTHAAVAYIADHFDEPLKRDSLAGLCHLSPSAFTRAFRIEQRATFEHFLMEYRIARAKELLSAPYVSISQIAYRVGFKDVSYFSRVFKRLTGIPASVYHHRAQSAHDPAASEKA